MSAPTITLLQDTDGSLAFTDSSGSGAGTWTTLTGPQYAPGYVGTSPTDPSTTVNGTARATASGAGALGDRARLTAWSGHSLYKLSHTQATGGEYTHQTDAFGLSTHSDYNTDRAGTVYYRVLEPLARQLANGTHTTTLTALGNGIVTVDAFVVVSGARGTPIVGNLVVHSDSWGNGGGVPTALAGFPGRVLRTLQRNQLGGKTITLIRHSVSGDALWGQANPTYPSDGSGNRVGGMYRLIDALVNGRPEYLVIQFSTNDLVTFGGSSADFVRHLESMLCLIEDSYDTTQLKCSVGLPGFVSRDAVQVNAPGPSLYGNGLDVFESAIYMTHSLLDRHAWVRRADVYTAADQRLSFVYPNSNSDRGAHNNHAGVGPLAEAHSAALTA